MEVEKEASKQAAEPRNCKSSRRQTQMITVVYPASFTKCNYEPFGFYFIINILNSENFNASFLCHCPRATWLF